MILDTYTSFLTEFFQLLSQTSLNLSDFHLDHIAYYTSSTSEYETTKNELQASGMILKAENLVDARRVALFVNSTPLSYENEEFSAIEVIEPLPGEQTTSRWEHAELLSNFTLEELLAKYPGINWDSSKINREQFPMLKIKLSDKIQAKFPRNSAFTESS